MIIVQAVNNAFASYIRLCNYATLNSNEPIKVAHLQKSANQSVLNGTLVIENGKTILLVKARKTFVV